MFLGLKALLVPLTAVHIFSYHIASKHPLEKLFGKKMYYISLHLENLSSLKENSI